MHFFRLHLGTKVTSLVWLKFNPQIGVDEKSGVVKGAANSDNGEYEQPALIQAGLFMPFNRRPIQIFDLGSSVWLCAVGRTFNGHPINDDIYTQFQVG